MKQAKQQYVYDVNYRLRTTSVFSVIASSEAEAKRKALEELENASKNELIDRFLAALDFDPNWTITYVEEIEEWDPEADTDIEGGEIND